MLVVLPLLAFCLLFLILLGREAVGDPHALEWRWPFVQACLLWGGLVVAITELLGLGSGLARPWLAMAWTLVLILLLALGWRIHVLVQGLRAAIALPSRLHGVELVLAGCFGAVLAGLLAIAFVAPPNNNDSLLYHMARVAHWAQAQNLNHYPTAFEPQLFNPIWAEVAILNFRILWGNDQLAGLIQWFSAVGSLIAASGIAATLGASRKGQWLAAAFVLSIPMGILQATSTQNDYVTSLWLVCLAYICVRGTLRKLNWLDTGCAGLALGLGMLTKGTFYPYAAPFIVWLVVTQWRLAGLAPMSARLSIIGGLTVILNAGYWGRDVATFGGPLGPAGWLQAMTAGWGGLAGIGAALIRNIMQNFPTPSESLNARLQGGVGALLRFLGDPRGIRLTWFWNHEDLAGNPIHLALVPVTASAAAVGARDRTRRLTIVYAAAVLASYVALALVVKYDAFGVRYQLPFFVAWAPVVGVIAAWILKDRHLTWLIVLFTVLSIPWLLLNDTRPLVGWKPRTATDSVFVESQARILLANWPQKLGPYTQAVDQVKGRGCNDVALRIDSHDPEYAFWWLFNAPQSGTRLEVISFDDPALAKYVDSNFKPCAIICTVCGQRERLHGLPLVGQYGSVSVFAGSDYLPGEND